MIRRAWINYKWNKAEKKRKKAEKAKKNKGKKKKKKKKAAPKPDQVTAANGVANINTIGMDMEDEEEPQDEEMDGEMEGENGEMEDKGEGEDEGASPSKDGDSPERSHHDGEHDEELDRDENDHSKSARDNLLSIASQNKQNFQPILDDDQLNIELNIERTIDSKSDLGKLQMIVEMAELEMKEMRATPRDQEVQTRPVRIVEINEQSAGEFDMSDEIKFEEEKDVDAQS